MLLGLKGFSAAANDLNWTLAAHDSQVELFAE